MEKPYLYWAGNKYYAMEQMLPYIGSGDLFVELFVGSGAVFINTDFKRYELYDINKDLIDLHQCVQQYEYFPQMAIGMLEQVMNNETDYYNIRKIFNESRTGDIFYRSMLLLYLNRVCFHGVMQYNKRKGEFNSPFGWREKISIDVDKMKYFREKSKQAQFICNDYKEVHYHLFPPGTVVYADPPYLASSKTAKFTGYTPAGFTVQDHINLNQLGVDLRQRGIKMIVSSAHTEEAKEIYKDGCPVEIVVPAKVSRYKGYNGKRPEYLFIYE